MDRSTRLGASLRSKLNLSYPLMLNKTRFGAQISTLPIFQDWCISKYFNVIVGPTTFKSTKVFDSYTIIQEHDQLSKSTLELFHSH